MFDFLTKITQVDFFYLCWLLKTQINYMLKLKLRFSFLSKLISLELQLITCCKFKRPEKIELSFEIL